MQNNQKISEIEYKRIDIDKFNQTMAEIISKTKLATSANELSVLRQRYVDILIDISFQGEIANIRNTLNTKDEFYSQEKEFWDNNSPIISQTCNEFIKTLVNNPHFEEYAKTLNPLIVKEWELQLKCMNPSIIEDLQQENATVTEYVKLMSGLLFNFEGKQIPLTILRKYMADANRDVRKNAYCELGRVLGANRDKFEDIYDRLVHIRTRMAHKLGYDDFIQLGYDRLGRVGFNRQQVESFRQNVINEYVPFITKVKAQVSQDLNLGQIMLYDNDTVLKDGAPSPTGTPEEILKKGEKMYQLMGEPMGEFMKMMIRNEALDVLSRENKWGGGYCTSLVKYNQPFILANFNGSSDDIDVLTHEGGHALAYYMTFDHDIELGIGGMETAEVHSMSMEFFTHKFMDMFFGDKATDYKYHHINSALTFIPYGTMVDHFQHIMYQNENLTPKERNQVWLDLEKQYRPYLSMDGIDYLQEGTRWVYQMHIFESPFYYIDYCLAQTVALEFLVEMHKNYDEAFQKYIKFVKSSGLKDFSSLVADAGLDSPFQKGTLQKTAQAVQGILDKLR